MAILKQLEVNELVDTILASGVDTLDLRRNFFLSVNRSFFTLLRRSDAEKAQLVADIGRMNEVERLADGQIPLLVYLQNVAFSLSGLQQEVKIREVIDRIIQTTSGAKLPDLRNVPEIKEAIIHNDDTVTFDFIRGGLSAAAAVVKLKVPSFGNGKPRLQNDVGPQMIFLGTGWLLSDSLLITNHHVINARMDNEAPAAEPDLHLQAKQTTVIFDFDADGLEGNLSSVTALLAWDEKLDYAVLKIPPTARTALRCAKVPLNANGAAIAVNIIQHPAGKSKRYGIRNNLVSGATATDLRYFTDTDGGSSGSPVLTDQWEVVALHRAAMYVSGVRFQGKDTAYVNIGTHISVVLDDIRTRYPALAAEIQ